jgi:ABC-type lipoprotein release transport system permease subunit
LAGSRSPDPVAFLGAALLLAMVAAVACLLPARKASRIDPAITLRIE